MNKNLTKAFSIYMMAIVFGFIALITSVGAQAEIPEAKLDVAGTTIEGVIIQSMSEVYLMTCSKEIATKGIFNIRCIRKADRLTFKFQIDTEFRNPAMNGVKTLGTIPLTDVNDNQLREMVSLITKRSLNWFKAIDSRTSWNGVVSNGGILFKGPHSFTAVFDQIDQTSVAFVEVDVDESNNLQVYLGYAG